MTDLNTCKWCGDTEHVAGDPDTFCPAALAEYQRAIDPPLVWVCHDCAHTFTGQTGGDPDDCENCGGRRLEGFPDLEDAEARSEEILLEASR